MHFPRNITEKQERILSLLAHKNGNIGEIVELNIVYNFKFFAKTSTEAGYLLELMNNKGLINCKVTWTSNGQAIFQARIRIAENGWLLLEKNMSNQLSKKVFIAMWFDGSMTSAYSAIEEALEHLGFDALRIDLKEHNNEISGEILYEIRQCMFIIADVTGQRHGVYFEAGFALGQNIPVIWSCRSDQIREVHFDTRQYNHIVWENEDDLKAKVIRRVKGTIL